MHYSLSRIWIPFFVAALAFLSTGCDQRTKVADLQNANPEKQLKGKNSPANKVAASDTPEVEKASNPEPAKDSAPANEKVAAFSSLGIMELGALAEQALAENSIETVTKSIAEMRGRESLPLGTKMEIARILFGAGAMKDSAQVYDEVLEARPDIKPQLWQRGLALYYAGEFKKGVEQFETHQTYNSQDVENSVWHLLCQSQLTSVKEARSKMIKIERDSRIPMKQVFDMFAGTGSPKEVLEACGYENSASKPDSAIYHGLIYIGLFHEMMGDQKASNESMTEALKFVIPRQGLMSHVAEGHLRARKAYPVDRDEK